MRCSTIVAAVEHGRQILQPAECKLRRPEAIGRDPPSRRLLAALSDAGAMAAFALNAAPLRRKESNGMELFCDGSRRHISRLFHTLGGLQGVGVAMDAPVDAAAKPRSNGGCHDRTQIHQHRSESLEPDESENGSERSTPKWKRICSRAASDAGPPVSCAWRNLADQVIVEPVSAGRLVRMPPRRIR